MLLLSLLACVAVTLATPNADATFKSEMNSKVVPSFNTAVRTYKDDIVGRLAAVTDAQINSNPNAVAKRLNCDVNKLSSTLKTCVSGCNQVKQKMDKALQDAVAEESALQIQLKQLNDQQVENRKMLAALQANLRDANNKVNQAQTALNNAEAELRRQEQRLRDAREDCIGKRRRKRGIGSFIKKVIRAPERIIRKTVIKPLEKVACSVFNRGGINNAKHARGLARNNLNNAHNRVNQLKQEVSVINTKIANQNTKINQATANLNQVRAKNAGIKKHRGELAVVTQKAKVAVSKVTQFLGRSEVLQDAVENMVFFDEIVGPLDSVAEHLKKSHLQAEGLTVDREKMQKMTTHLQALKAKVPDYPFVEDVSCD